MAESSMPLSQSNCESVTQAVVARASAAGIDRGTDLVAVEEPLEIRVEWQDGSARRSRSLSITMRTPGDDDALAAGFMIGEGIVHERSQIESIDRGGNIVTVHLAAGATIDWPRLERHFYSTSSCGVCGKASLDALELRGVRPIARAGLGVTARQVLAMPELMRHSQVAFAQTGGLHAAGLFRFAASGDPELVALHEDVGRHNALDKVIGSQFLGGTLPLCNFAICLSGRASFELLQKALYAGVPLIAAVGAPSSLAIDLASSYGITLIGFLRGETFNIYNAPWRVEQPA